NDVRERSSVVLKSRSYMNPPERSTDIATDSVTVPLVKPAPPVTPALPKEPPWTASAGVACPRRVITLTVPPKASAAEGGERVRRVCAARYHFARSPKAVGAKERRADALQHLDTLHFVQRHRNVAV